MISQAANIKKALEEFSWLPCCCHILNVVLSRAFKFQQKSAKNQKSEEEINSIAIFQKSEIELPQLDLGSNIQKVVTLVIYLKQSGLAPRLTTTMQDIEMLELKISNVTQCAMCYWRNLGFFTQQH